MVQSPEAVFQYKCDNYYAPQHEGAIIWNDPDPAIDRGIPTEAISLSEKDTRHRPLKEMDSSFDYHQSLY